MSRAAKNRQIATEARQAPDRVRSSSPDLPQLSYSVESFARAMTLPRATVYQLMEAGVLETFKVGRRRLIAAQDAANFLQRARAGDLAQTLEQLSKARPAAAA